jgi:aerobic carbon-monoxide dehydrogenase small subunit
MTQTTITLNGKALAADVPARTHLADFIREHAGLTGTHLGCEHGICGACTVEIDGEIARSCITFAAACDGAAVRTIEGFDSDPVMVLLRQAFTEEHGLQCGYCTPGMLIAARDLIRRGAATTERDVRIAMSGNLCRCTGYAGIVRAIMRVLSEELSLPSNELPNRAVPLGPVGSLSKQAQTEAGNTSLPAGETRPISAPAHRAPGARKRIHVVTQAPRDLNGKTVLSQSFVLPHACSTVWSKMRDLASLVDCLPGARLTKTSPDGSFEGTVTLSFGPIAPSFSGRGRFSASDADLSGEVEGAGREQRGTSNATGRMTFKLSPEGGDATRVSTEITYKLTGPLAQFARPSLVTGVLSEIGSAFASNLDRTLSGELGATLVERKLSVWSVLRALLQSWITRLFKRF